ncbi:MAG: glycosyltransferase family 1 protein [Chloroflexota bacterium]
MQIGINGAFWEMQATGSGQYLRQLLAALVAAPAAGAAEERYTLYLPGRPGRNGAETSPGVGVETLAPPPGWRRENLAKLWFEQHAVPRACARRGDALLHVPYFAPPLRARVPVVVTIHDLIPLLLAPYRGSAGVRAYMGLVSSAARRAALVLTDSQASARDIERLLRIPPERLRVVPLAASRLYRPLPPAERAPVLRRLGIAEPYLLYPGGFDVRKNVPGLLRAYALACGRLGELRLVIAGRLPEHSAFTPDPRAVAHDLGIEAQVYFTGWVDEADKPALYSGALAFVFPSRYEGFGLPVLEALACGTPAIYARGSSLDEIAGPGGLAVPPQDDGALAEALVACATDDALRLRLGAEGYRHATRFSWEQAAAQTRAAYRAALR